MTLPMALPRSLPLAPRPFPDESIRSWIGRVAARYDLAPAELVTRLRDGPGVHVSRLFPLDWQEDAELDHLLAQAARLDEARIRALRLVVTDRPKPALWHRTLLAWCPACACEDVFVRRHA
ncbi:MAG: TniQ family protein, partial [Sphingomonadaceae bacterium]|nr:TniQ family protein [Sphingomonadaceae bacterium]